MVEPVSTLLTRSGRPAAWLWSLRPDVAYLNHAAFGAVPLAAQQDQVRWRAEMEADPDRWFRRLPTRVATARRAVSRHLGTEPERTALLANASAAATVAMDGLRLAARDEVIVTDHIYGAVLSAVHRAVRRAGATVVSVHVPLAAGPTEAADTVVAAVGCRTAAVVLDQITSSTFRRLPTAVVADRIHPVPVVVDGAHAAGLLPSAVIDSGATLWFGNLHKYWCAPKSCAALWVHPGFDASRLRPPVASWDEDAPFPAAFDQQGTADVSAWLAAAAGIDRLEEAVGWDRLRRHTQDVADAIASRVPAADVGMPAPGGVLVDLPAVLVPDPAAARSIAARLSDRGVAVGVTWWRGRGFLRVTGHGYTTAADVDHALTVLADPGLW